jgi:hypothetical protein
MQWHIVDKAGKEPIGVSTQMDIAHRSIDAHNRAQKELEVSHMTRSEYAQAKREI